MLQAHHLDDNAASEFVSGTLPESALTRVEGHLAGCRECRALVAALAGDVADSNVATAPHERESPSQVSQRPTRTLTIGDRVGRYLVLSALGAGGMGVVFAAYDPQLDRKVALKLLRAGSSYNTRDARTRLRREAQAIAQLSHPNVVNVYDVGSTDDDDLYIAMEFVEGDTLTSWLRKYPRTWREIVDVFLQAARGVIAAHSVGLLHRDFKPDNVLVGGDGRVRVTDFGLARSVIAPDEAGPRGPYIAALSVELTATGTVLGTPRYMAPEQLTGPDIDARADQFAFCVALYEALYGSHPLPGATSVSMLERNDRAVPPPDGTKVPAAIGRAVLRGLERDRAKRYPTMAALVGELSPVPARPAVRSAAAVAVVGVLLAGGAIAAAVSRPEPPDDPSPRDSNGKPISVVQPLVSQLNDLNVQLREREAENRALREELARRITDAGEIAKLTEEIARRDKQIVDLGVQINRLDKKVRDLTGRPAPPSQGELARDAFIDAHGDLESCFTEWGAREPGDADLSIAMTVSPEGGAHSVIDTTAPVSREGTELDRLGPALRVCVSDALGRVRFAPGPEQIDLVVKVQWSASDRAVNVSGQVIGRRKAVQHLLE
ncbi:MAG: protein kinase domain-containing protein [Kofleriaceae bacterium]